MPHDVTWSETGQSVNCVEDKAERAIKEASEHGEEWAMWSLSPSLGRPMMLQGVRKGKAVNHVEDGVERAINQGHRA